MDKIHNNVRQNTYTSLLLAQHKIVDSVLQCKEQKQGDLLHLNKNRNPMSKKQSERYNT